MSRWFRELWGNAPLRLRFSLIVTSGAGYGLSIIFLGDEERGILTGLLFGSYLLVATSFGGTNTFLAHWTRGEFASQMKVARRLARPGKYLSLLVAVVGVILILQAPDRAMGFYVLIFGVFTLLNSLGEALAAAKMSSRPVELFWQHYVFMLLFLACFVLLVTSSQATGLWVLLCYTIASIPFLTGLAVRKGISREEIRVLFPIKTRLESLKLFAETLSGSMRLRLTGLIVAITSGPLILGQYVVLWLGFEVLEQLLKMGLLTRVFEDKKLDPDDNAGLADKREKLFRRWGIPVVVAVTAISIFLGIRFTTADSMDIVLASALLALAYGLRGPLSIRQSSIRASGRLGTSAAIALFDAGTTVLLVTILPLFLGFSGVAIGLAISSLIVLIVVRRSVGANVDIGKENIHEKDLTVSVIMPARNAEKTICQSIESVRSQDWDAWELIIVDDGSTDRTPELVALYTRIDSRIRVVRNPTSRGTGPARLRGVNISRGEVIAFLDADDIWLSRKLSDGINFMDATKASWIHSAHRSIQSNGKVSVKIRSRGVKRASTLVQRNIITNSTVMVRRELLPKKFSFIFNSAQDMELWLELARAGNHCAYFPSANTLYRISSQSLSGDKILAAKRHWRNLSIIEPNPANRIANYFVYSLSASFVFSVRKMPCMACSAPEEYLEELQRQVNRVVNPEALES